MSIMTERIYLAPRRGRSFRVLVDRLWPRGLRRDEVLLDLWLKEIAPSDELRVWFAHDPAKWPEFKRRYFLELAGKAGAVERLLAEAHGRDIIILYGAHDQEHNNALALKEYLEKSLVPA